MKWDDIHFRLNSCSYNDERWSAKNFGGQRVSDVNAALSWIEKHDVAKYNLESISIAKLGSFVAGSLGGKKTRISPQDFLPFDTRKIRTENGITDKSVEVLRRLMKTKAMDGRVIALLAEELKSASARSNDE
ncbi:hypothetical protein UFOVP383_124 [uncultured Caudovirales phage]|uniref:Uncharacterized protein n=1 Tax=uncultured Caudovirales phage TaxID=2100421 RepID=A0A6J7WZS6_9CAUD|nr:hypothetical protein UFOVP383_124 [uncultured Caudovirales phage]